MSRVEEQISIGEGLCFLFVSYRKYEGMDKTNTIGIFPFSFELNGFQKIQNRFHKNKEMTF